MYRDDIRALAAPLYNPGDFDPLLDRLGDVRVVMLGEASHGTHDFYRWRAELTQRLIAECGFSFVAVEGDWPDCDRVDRAVRGRPGGVDPRLALAEFDRWPTWMWANEEVSDFCRWLQGWNCAHSLPSAAPVGSPGAVGFHGLDVYSLWDSLREILLYLQHQGPAGDQDPNGVHAALAALRCLAPYGQDPQRYAWATVMGSTCAPALVELLTTVRRRAAAAVEAASQDPLLGAPLADPFRAFDVRQNAEAAVGAEHYYREMVSNGPEAWNVRDTHMVNTLHRLLEYYGPTAKAVVWAHNTHIGDARATDMADAGMVNLGQLARERWGSDAVALVGFGCHRGDVLASPRWGDPVEVMPIPPASAGSLEARLYAATSEPAVFVFPPGVFSPGGGSGAGGQRSRPAWLADPLPHRAIGVVYSPSREAYSNYVPTRLGDRYDAFVWLPTTTALRPLPTATPTGRELETFPLGV